jgi:hypothetical protein
MDAYLPSKMTIRITIIIAEMMDMVLKWHVGVRRACLVMVGSVHMMLVRVVMVSRLWTGTTLRRGKKVCRYHGRDNSYRILLMLIRDRNGGHNGGRCLVDVTFVPWHGLSAIFSLHVYWRG